MNYWPRWISAIKKRTAGLSLAEMGAYDRLLDHYYAEEAPLPGDLDECCRLAVAITKDERRAVEKVLAKFFTLTPEGYRNERADEEISIALPKIAAAQANGKRGGRPKGLSKKPGGFPDGLPLDTHDEPKSKAPHHHPYQHHTENPPDAGGGGQAPGDGEFDPGQVVGSASPTAAGALCRTLRQAGIADVNPGHPRLLALLAAGAQPAEFAGFVAHALDKAPANAFVYLLGVVEGERKRATVNAGQMLRGVMPNKQEALEQRNRAVGQSWLAKMKAEGAVDAAE